MTYYVISNLAHDDRIREHWVLIQVANSNNTRKGSEKHIPWLEEFNNYFKNRLSTSHEY